MLTDFRNLMFAASMFTAAIASTPSAWAAGWADGLFPTKTHNFGTVAVASDTKFRFPIQNNTNTDIHISTVRASCGCTTPTVETEWVRAGSSGSLLATFNTDTFKGKKGATLTVVIDRPVYAEVRLRVDGYIRQDIVFNPGSVEFGNVRPGEQAEKTVSIGYAGRDNWQIVDIENTVPYLKTSLKQTSRGGQRVNYGLTVQLTDEAPVGYLQQELVLVTNDRAMPRVPVRVSGQVEAGLTISPSAIAVGSVKPGETVSQRLVVRGQQPFLIQDIACQGWDVEFDAPEKAKSTHLLTVRMTATNQPGEFRGPIVIRTAGDTGLTARALVTADIREK
ncbi:DUF1573 domain-containing protein [Roseimaritima ulvae]|uniref:DUF1573 domain-containing protein n=1 Tax=Roseimaritima ulvae TaxID=980254 RepID=A0A5B9QL02_9BACT|nr:DUF1573 domain-containing protein [Roseimaritima ulvae]QEG38679.1 hypothetical protein UC8_06370 [Roseimaritima ulvae]